MRFKLLDQMNRLDCQRVQKIKGHAVVIASQICPQSVIHRQIATGEQALRTADVGAIKSEGKIFLTLNTGDY